MALLVLKFGGTSVANHKRMAHVAAIIRSIREQGHEVVVVVSARSGDTNRLIQLAYEITEAPDPAEYDALVSTGELVSAALLSMQLQTHGIAARSFNAQQLNIQTDHYFRKARIENIDTHGLKAVLADGCVPIVTGFQGITKDRRVTTLGRGGSDTSALALAIALDADECLMYTDVDGVYTADPRVVSDARKLSQVSFDEMLALCSVGSRVLHIRAVEYAKRHKMPVRVLSSFDMADFKTSGTLITQRICNIKKACVAGIAFDSNQSRISLLRMKKRSGVINQIKAALSIAGIDLDMIVESNLNSSLSVDFSFTVHRDDYKEALMIADELAAQLSAESLDHDAKVAKLSLVGLGMQANTGVSALLFETLNKEGIVTQLSSTSEIKVSVVLDETAVEAAVQALHQVFGLANSMQLTL